MTTIQWTDETWNPTTGCTRVSEGCRNCYIERTPPFRMQGRKLGDPVQFHHDRLDAPLHWKKPRRVFVNSLSDLFHEDVPDEFIDKVFLVMFMARQHTFQILTKRAGRMQSYVANNETMKRLTAMCALAVLAVPGSSLKIEEKPDGLDGFQAGNVWLGVSIEDQKTADERIPILLQTPAAVRFVSAEPLLDSVDLGSFVWPCCIATKEAHDKEHDGGLWCDERGLDWVIVGGESGPGARPCDIAWIRSIKAQCQEAGVPVFVKQLGLRAYSEPDCIAYRNMRFGMATDGFYRFLKDKKGGDMNEWPEDLRVREFPR